MKNEKWQLNKIIQYKLSDKMKSDKMNNKIKYQLSDKMNNAIKSKLIDKMKNNIKYKLSDEMNNNFRVLKLNSLSGPSDWDIILCLQYLY